MLLTTYHVITASAFLLLPSYSAAASALGREGRNLRRRLNSSSSCDPSARTVEIALAFDSAFCLTEGGGDYHAALTVLLDIVDKVQKLYEAPHVCRAIRISHIEGYCDKQSDPYHDLSSPVNGRLDDFIAFWESDRPDVHRDTAHLVTGRAFFEDTTFG